YAFRYRDNRDSKRERAMPSIRRRSRSFRLLSSRPARSHRVSSAGALRPIRFEAETRPLRQNSSIWPHRLFVSNGEDSRRERKPLQKRGRPKAPNKEDSRPVRLSRRRQSPYRDAARAIGSPFAPYRLQLSSHPKLALSEDT